MNHIDLKAAVRELRVLFDPARYLALYPDIAAMGIDPVEHYLRYGAHEGREPCALFDTNWYIGRYADVSDSSLNPLLHYIRHGATEMRDPNPHFNATYYVTAHPEASGNPLLFHLLHGASQGWPTEPRVKIDDLLPSQMPFRDIPDGLTVDVIIPVFRNEMLTRRCIKSVLADPIRPPGRILVVDDRSPEPRLCAWLDTMAEERRIVLLRNPKNIGFVRSVNRGIAAAGRSDVVILNSDTEVPAGWLTRLARVAHSAPNIASASPFSNNATICSWPNSTGGTMPAGLSLEDADMACQAANTGRVIDLPTTVGFCMYVRRAALDIVGGFDVRTFGHGYGEEVDFCLRASANGWRHVLACNIFVYHVGEASFGADSPHARKGQAALERRYPDYKARIGRHTIADPTNTARFAATAAFFRHNALPGILLITHQEGGGVQRHIDELIHALRGKGNVMLLRPNPRGIELSVPGLAGHPTLALGPEQTDDLIRYLRSAAINYVHIHHIMGITMDIQALIAGLAVPFYFTVHDYFAICPQINLLPWPDAEYCGDPTAQYCNACIAANPAHGATDIHSWRWKHRWIFRGASHVICPSEDTRARLVRHNLGQSALVIPHEPDRAAFHQLTVRRLAAGERLKVALLGVLADRKGLPSVTAVTEAADDNISFHLIGHPERVLAPSLAARLTVTGPYNDSELPNLIARVAPHIFWFPAQWPETYSYTLSAAIAAGGAIIATDIGAFTERLRGRPLTWLVPPGASAETWLRAFTEARAALSYTRSGLRHQPADQRQSLADAFYTETYLRPISKMPRRSRGRARSAPRRVALIAERTGSGLFSSCAYIRLLQPLHHPTIGDMCDVHVVDNIDSTETDMVITQRHAVTTPSQAATLIRQCRARGSRLIYDLDDDLVHLPDAHPDAERLRPLTRTVSLLLDAADAIWVSTSALADGLGPFRDKARVVANGLDENLWWPPPNPERMNSGPLRLLYMGTATHAADLALILPALTRLLVTFGARVAVDIIGVTPHDLPDGINRIDVPYHAGRSYPAFVNWLSQENRWHIGLAPLVDNPFNRSKSAIKAMDYAALGIPTVASAIGVYEAAVNDGISGILVPNTDAAWYAALAGLIRDPARRRRLAVAAAADFTTRFSLATQAKARRSALLDE